MASDGQVRVGEEVAGYRVERLVGRGGMGDVYRAHDDSLERPVALKLLADRYAEDDDLRERIMRESRLAAGLDHPNVVPVYEAGEAEGRVYIAMRYVDGTDLRALLRREGALEPTRAVEIASQVANALDAAHARGLVHRDVKPSNVLIDGARALLPRRFRTDDDRLGPRPGAGWPFWGRSTTSRPSRSAVTTSMGGQTCTRSAACSSSA